MKDPNQANGVSAAPSLAGVGLREGLIPAFEPPPIRASPPVADHELLGIIGKGAYGEVWLGRHTRLSVLRAVKIVRRSQFAEARPFQREFEGIRRYEPISRGHPNLVNVLHVGGTDECFYYVMELADPAGGGESKVQGGRPWPTPIATAGWPALELGFRISGFLRSPEVGLWTSTLLSRCGSSCASRGRCRSTTALPSPGAWPISTWQWHGRLLEIGDAPFRTIAYQ